MKLAGLGERAYLATEGIDAGDNPSVLIRHLRKILADIIAVPDAAHIALRLKRVQNHIRERETVDIPENVCRAVSCLDAFPVELQIIPRCARRKDIQPQNIDTDLLYDLFGRDDIADGLRHLPALAVECETVHEDAPVWRFVKRNHGCAELGIEPAACLILTFGDEIRGPQPLEVFRLCGETYRRPRCHCRVEPDIEDILDAAHGAAAALRTRIGNLIDIRTVGVGEV